MFQVNYASGMRVAVNTGRDIYREGTVLRCDYDHVVVRVDAVGGDENAIDGLQPRVAQVHLQPAARTRTSRSISSASTSATACSSRWTLGNFG